VKFEKYLNEAIAATKRKDMMHLEKMKPLEFLALAREIMSKNKGILKDVKFSLKVDGAGIRFGKDASGKFFFETSRSGPIQKKNAFSEYASTNPRADLERAKHYDAMFDQIEASNIWKWLPNDTKVIAEVLYNPMAEVIEDKIKFVSVLYDKSKLGSLMTIIPFAIVSASESAPVKDEKKLLAQLLKKGDSKIKIETAALPSRSLNVETIVKPALALGDDVEQILTSRKAADKEKKLLYNIVIQDVKDQLAKQILSLDLEGIDKFGKEIEGLVLDFGNRQMKVTTQTFKDSKKK
jgi:hypothetical protein